MDYGRYLLPAALLFDCLIGDPRSALHPVVLIGNMIAFLEKRLRCPGHSPAMKQAAGLAMVIIVLTVTYGCMWWVTQWLKLWLPGIAFGVNALLLSFTISPRSLAAAGREIRNNLVLGKLADARFKVGWIVGRDTDRLSAAEVTRATVETVAENIVDGVISPLFYAALGGVPLAFLYRAVNTLDSMIGYKNEKYVDFGRVAARVDDVFNYFPARITGFLIVVAAFWLRLNARGAAAMLGRDAAKHPSPNSGWAEAGVAGALGIRLGGENYYGGIRSFRAYMGDPHHPLAARHIDQTITIMYAVTLLFVAAVMLIRSYGGL